MTVVPFVARDNRPEPNLRRYLLAGRTFEAWKKDWTAWDRRHPTDRDLLTDCCELYQRLHGPFRK